MKYIKYINESFTESHHKLSKDDQIISDILIKYRKEYNKEDFSNINSDDLKKSLQLIGDGEVIDKQLYGESFMYKEYFNDGKYVLIVHGSIGKPFFTKGYTYEISFWRIRSETIRRIYGDHKNLFYGNLDGVFYDVNLISNVVNDLLPYLKNKIDDFEL